MSARGGNRVGGRGNGSGSGSLSAVSKELGDSADASGGASASVLSDVTRDEIQCFFRTHDDLLEIIYQVAIPAVFDIFRAMLKEVAKVSDSPEALAVTFEDSLSRVSEWNRMTVREITRSWSKLGKQLIMLVRKCAKVKAMILRKNELVTSADVNVTLEFSSILHSILVFSSSALIEEMPALLKSKGSQACMEIMLRRHQVVEKAVVHLIRDGLNDLLLDEPVRTSASAPGTFPTRFAGESAPDASSSYVGPLRYSVPQIEQAKCKVPVEQDGKEVKFDFDMLQQEDHEIPDGLGVPDEDFPSDDETQAAPSQSQEDDGAEADASESVDVQGEDSVSHGDAATGTLNISNTRVPVTISRDVARVLLRDM